MRSSSERFGLIINFTDSLPALILLQKFFAFQPFEITMQPIRAGERIYLILDHHRKWIRTANPTQQFHSDKGFIDFKDVIGKHPGQTFLLSPYHRKVAILRPLLSDFIFHMKRQSQIIYPEDIGSILIYGNARPNSQILEAGTGSGTVTGILANFSQPDGHIYSFDIRESALKQAKKNIEHMGMKEHTTVDLGNILEKDYNFENINFIMLDLATPWLAVPRVKKYLDPVKGRICLFSPTLEQVKKNINALIQNQFQWYKTFELMKRFYQVKQNATRPLGRMVGHTGYMTYGAFSSVDKKLQEIGFDDLYSPENLGNLFIYAQFTLDRKILILTKDRSQLQQILTLWFQNTNNITFQDISNNEDMEDFSEVAENQDTSEFDIICLNNCYSEPLFLKSIGILRNGGVFCGIHSDLEHAKQFHLTLHKANFYDLSTSEIIKREIKVDLAKGITYSQILPNYGFITFGRKVKDNIQIKEGPPIKPEKVDMILDVGRNMERGNII